MEIAAHNPVLAVQYLQTELAQMVDHNDLEESQEVRGAGGGGGGQLAQMVDHNDLEESQEVRGAGGGVSWPRWWTTVTWRSHKR